MEITLDHVLDVRTNCSDSGQLLLCTKPFLDFKRAFAAHVKVQRQMFEVAFQDATGSLDGHNTRLYAGLNATWNFYTLVCVNGPHFESVK